MSKNPLSLKKSLKISLKFLKLSKDKSRSPKQLPSPKLSRLKYKNLLRFKSSSKFLALKLSNILKFLRRLKSWEKKQFKYKTLFKYPKKFTFIWTKLCMNITKDHSLFMYQKLFNNLTLSKSTLHNIIFITNKFQLKSKQTETFLLEHLLIRLNKLKKKFITKLKLKL